jgi:hypothetical protein
MNAVMARLANQGIRIEIDTSNKSGEVFIAELPNGDIYRLVRARLLKLMEDGKLDVMGILEAGLSLEAKTGVPHSPNDVD